MRGQPEPRRRGDEFSSCLRAMRPHARLSASAVASCSADSAWSARRAASASGLEAGRNRLDALALARKYKPREVGAKRRPPIRVPQGRRHVLHIKRKPNSLPTPSALRSTGPLDCIRRPSAAFDRFRDPSPVGGVSPLVLTAASEARGRDGLLRRTPPQRPLPLRAGRRAPPPPPVRSSSISSGDGGARPEAASYSRGACALPCAIKPHGGRATENGCGENATPLKPASAAN